MQFVWTQASNWLKNTKRTTSNQTKTNQNFVTNDKSLAAVRQGRGWLWFLLSSCWRRPERAWVFITLMPVESSEWINNCCSHPHPSFEAHFLDQDMSRKKKKKMWYASGCEVWFWILSNYYRLQLVILEEAKVVLFLSWSKQIPLVTSHTHTKKKGGADHELTAKRSLVNSCWHHHCCLLGTLIPLLSRTPSP